MQSASMIVPTRCATMIFVASFAYSFDMAAVTRVGWTLVALYVAYALCSYVQSWMMATVTHPSIHKTTVSTMRGVTR